ncbi:Vesicle-associated protein 2-2 [Carex littledalei]|uniref:Vesicle-associated protein 2-2 n=1 Tax=Carex littledalei TaxID=544730 RepID=A0A833RZ24_9POAL|nr:Vesicle-associated protein 2-2 [Carex littledalei]
MKGWVSGCSEILGQLLTSLTPLPIQTHVPVMPLYQYSHPRIRSKQHPQNDIVLDQTEVLFYQCLHLLLQFSKDSGRYIEERKLRVVLISPPNSPEHPLHHASNGNGSPNPVSPRPKYEEVPSPKDNPTVLRQESPGFTQESITFAKESPGFTKESSIFAKESPVFFKESPPVSKESRALLGDTPHLAVKDSQVGFVRPENLQFSHVSEDVENLKLKVNILESKLHEAEKMIVRMRDEGTVTIQERDTLQKEMVSLRKKTGGWTQIGFPFLFVVYMALVGMALVGMALGYFMHP